MLVPIYERETRESPRPRGPGKPTRRHDRSRPLRGKAEVIYAFAVDGPYNTNPPPFNPATEAWPGGPPPGAIAQMEAEERRAQEKQAQELHGEDPRRTKHLLLHRR